MNQELILKPKYKLSAKWLNWVQTKVKNNNTLPVSSATVEKGFCGMNQIITYARNSLLSSLAGDLIRFL